MAGRKSELHWTKSRGQYTTTIDGVFYPLGTDKEGAERQFRFLLNKHDLGEPVDTNPTFAQVVDQWLDHVHKSHDADRYRLCKARMEEFRAGVIPQQGGAALQGHGVQGVRNTVRFLNPLVWLLASSRIWERLHSAQGDEGRHG